MPQQPPYDPGHLARLYLSQVPAEIRKQLGNDELNDRLIESARLGAQANDPKLSPELRRAARIRAGAVLGAQPRQVTRQQHQDLIRKAASVEVQNPAQAIALRRAADRLEQDHPIAPTRAERVRKAKAESDQGIVAVFDADGNMVGICDPEDVTPVAGSQATPAAPAALAGEPVAKGQRLSVWDVNGRRYVTTRGRIRKTAEPRPGVYDDGPLYRVLGDSGWGTGVASPEEQARNRGPVNVGGTTGLGEPRRAGPPAALPGDGPQAARPGDVPGRQVIKSSLGLPFRTVGEGARERRLERIAKATGRDFTGRHAYARNPFASDGACVCEAPAGHRVHTGTAPGTVAKSLAAQAAAWRPALQNPATDRWLAAQRRR